MPCIQPYHTHTMHETSYFNSLHPAMFDMLRPHSALRYEIGNFCILFNKFNACPWTCRIWRVARMLYLWPTALSLNSILQAQFNANPIYDLMLRGPYCEIVTLFFSNPICVLICKACNEVHALNRFKISHFACDSF